MENNCPNKLPFFLTTETKLRTLTLVWKITSRSKKIKSITQLISGLMREMEKYMFKNQVGICLWARIFQVLIWAQIIRRVTKNKKRSKPLRRVPIIHTLVVNTRLTKVIKLRSIHKKTRHTLKSSVKMGPSRTKPLSSQTYNSPTTLWTTKKCWWPKFSRRFTPIWLKNTHQVCKVLWQSKVLRKSRPNRWLLTWKRTSISKFNRSYPLRCRKFLNSIIIHLIIE